jgi:hypothetical protein
MKKTFVIILIFSFSSFFAQAQKKPQIDVSGYRFESKLKGPKHKNSKALEIMVGNNGNYFVATYAGPKRLITLRVHNLYTWELVGEYQFKGRAELYNSYFDSYENTFYVNTDIYKNMYKKINLDTHVVEEISCKQAPRGCEKLELESYVTELFTVGDNYYIKRDDERKNYIKVYKKKELFIDEMDYLGGSEDGEDGESTISFPDEISTDSLPSN